MVKETVNVPKGVDSNTNLRISKKGNVRFGHPPGNLYVSLHVKPHNYFKRDGADIHTDLYLTIS